MMRTMTVSRGELAVLLAEGQIPFDGISVEKGCVRLWADARLCAGKDHWVPQCIETIFVEDEEGELSEGQLSDIVRDALGEGTRYVYRVAPDGRKLADDWL